MRGLTILVAGADAVRLRSALTLAIAQAALGGRARLFLDSGAVPLLAAAANDDEAQVAAGQPPLLDLVALAGEAGVALLGCQTGLALAELAADQLSPHVEWTGITSVLATLGDDRLLSL